MQLKYYNLGNFAVVVSEDHFIAIRITILHPFCLSLRKIEFNIKFD